MNDLYTIADVSQLLSPSLVIFRDLVEQNLAGMIRIAGNAERLRPHCKTHKMREVVRMQLDAGITRHKCATIAEAEMLATAGAKDILLAYNPVGPNIQRVVRLCKQYPEVQFIVTADAPEPIAELGRQLTAADAQLEVLLDLNTGQNRTGVQPGDEAERLYRMIASTSGLKAGGLHLYDGQNHQSDPDERRAAVRACWNRAASLRDKLVASGQDVPRIVAGGTGSFPMYAELDDLAIELSPGTLIFHDANYRNTYGDLQFTPAALLLTRVVSRPTSDRVTFDLGYKAVASDPPAGRRLVIPAIPDAQFLLQNEEHLVVQTELAAQFKPGDFSLAIPSHVCPTCALHRSAYVVWDGQVQAEWEVAGRDRMLTI